MTFESPFEASMSKLDVDYYGFSEPTMTSSTEFDEDD